MEMGPLDKDCSFKFRLVYNTFMLEVAWILGGEN
jgi:hypothetical protein